MPELPDLPAGTSAALRERYLKLSPGDRARVLSGLASARDARARRFDLIPVAAAVPGSAQQRPPLVVMPSLLGSVVEWREFFGENAFERDVYGLEGAGGAAYWKPRPTLQEIAAACVDTLASALPQHRRLHLAGYSFGGRLAYEVARQLDAAGTPTVSVTLVDTSAVSAIRGLRWRDVRSSFSNLPAWLMYELSVYGVGKMGRRLGLRRRFRVRPDGRPDHLFDLNKFPEEYRQRVVDSHEAGLLYEVRPTTNRVTYLRCRIRSLIHRDQPDGGWGEFVRPSRLTVMAIPGDHGMALHPRQSRDVRAIVARALNQADAALVGDASADARPRRAI